MRTRDEIEDTVVALLRRHAISTVPVPVDLIATAEGVAVIEQTFTGDLSGALIRSNGMSAIAVNSTHSPNRKRFTVAHELGHHMLAHKGEEDHVDWEFTVIRRDGRSSEANNVQEVEANSFAASLLMPKAILSADLKLEAGPNGEIDLARDQIAFLARRYQVSEVAMKFRLINLGFLSPI